MRLLIVHVIKTKRIWEKSNPDASSAPISRENNGAEGGMVMVESGWNVVLGSKGRV